MKSKNFYWLLAITLLIGATLACRTLFPDSEIYEPDLTEPDSIQETVPDPEDSAVEATLQAADPPEETDTSHPSGKNDPQDSENELFEIPTLSGEEQIVDSEHFRIHYTLSGEDAVQNIDFINEIIETMEQVWAVEVSNLGWSPPPPDNGLGGDDRYDVYILNIFEEDGTAGYTDGGFEETFVGDNPYTPVVESRSHFSYLALDNDYSDLNEYDDIDYTILDYMRSTAAHEFSHAIQFAYDGEEPLEWLWEATATWFQTQVYPELHDADEELTAVFKSPDSCQLAYGGEERVEDENHWYGLWIFIGYIAENTSPKVVRQIWEQARELDGYEALEVALFDAGTTLDEAFRGFSLALLTRGFERGSEYPIVRLEGEASLGGIFAPVDGVGQMGADYIEILADSAVRVSLGAESLSGLLVAIKGDQASVFPMEDNQANIDASQFDHIYLIILNENRAATEFDCEFTPYTVAVEPGSQAPIQPISQFSAPNFIPPQVEGLLDPAEYWGDDWQSPVDPPEELIPAYIPEGYELYDSYELNKSEIDEYADWYIPGEGAAVVIDFYGPGQEDYFDITASDSPFSDLDGFLDFVDYEPYDEEMQTLKGVKILIQDWTEPDDPYSEVSFILNGQFIVLTGTLTPDEMLRVAESLLP